MQDALPEEVPEAPSEAEVRGADINRGKRRDSESDTTTKVNIYRINFNVKIIAVLHTWTDTHQKCFITQFLVLYTKRCCNYLLDKCTFKFEM